MLHGHDAVQKDRLGMLNAPGRIMGSGVMVVNGIAVCLKSEN
jgi:hypothetical protein